MLRLLVLLVALSIYSPARADWFYTLVGFQCDRTADRLTIRYRGAYNDEGKLMVSGKSATEWEPGSLIATMKDDDHIGTLRTIEATCRLRHSAYRLRIGATPGNFNIQGECGASVSAWVEVRRGSKLVLPHYELEGPCHDREAPVTTEISFSSSFGPPAFKKLLQDEFQK